MPAAAEMLNMNDFNDGVIVVSKVPRGKAGNKISIKLTIYNNGTKDDNILKEIRLADADAYEDIINREFGSSDSDDDDDDNDNDDGLRRYHDAFPFEVDSSTFKPKDINVKPGAHKTITLLQAEKGLAGWLLSGIFSNWRNQRWQVLCRPGGRRQHLGFRLRRLFDRGGRRKQYGLRFFHRGRAVYALCGVRPGDEF